MKHLLLKLAGEPLLHFTLLGAVLFASQDVWLPLLQPTTITVSQADSQRLLAQWQRDTGKQANRETVSALIQQYIDEEVLLHEARWLGLQARDPVVRERLIRNMRFVEQNQQRDDAALLDAALALGMLETDLVVRRRLLQRMRHRIEAQAAMTTAEVDAYFKRHAQHFAKPPRFTFQQLYFSHNASEKRLAAQSAIAAGASEETLGKLGEPFLLGNKLQNLSQDEIERQLGPEIAQAIVQAMPGEWIGPINSIYGQHLLRLEIITKSEPPRFADVRREVIARFYAEREDATLRATLLQLRKRYKVEIEPPRQEAS